MIKKLSTAIALSAFVLFGINCGGGSTDPLAGHIGHPCARTSFLGGSSCYDANSECHSGMCVSCGHTGEHCCNNSSRGCATGLTCEWDDSRSLDVCGGCGEVGERCCESRFSSTGTCNADAMCDPSSNECVTGPSGPCVGPEVFSIGVRDPNLCATEVRVVHSSSASDARSCVAMTLPPGYTTLELEDPPEEHEYCQLTPATMYRSTVQVLAFSDSDADTCARATCIDCSYTEGSCEEMDGGAPDGGP